MSAQSGASGPGGLRGMRRRAVSDGKLVEVGQLPGAGARLSGARHELLRSATSGTHHTSTILEHWKGCNEYRKLGVRGKVYYRLFPSREEEERNRSWEDEP